VEAITGHIAKLQLTLNDVDLLVNSYGPSAPRPAQGVWRVDGYGTMTRFPVTAPSPGVSWVVSPTRV
jgi:hypothetical protein